MLVKHQLKQNHRFLSRKGFSEKITFRYNSAENITKLQDYVKFNKLLSESIVKNCVTVSQVSVDGSLFDLDSIIVTNSNTQALDFGQVKHIIINETTNDIIFIYLQLLNNGYVDHFAAYP